MPLHSDVVWKRVGWTDFHFNNPGAGADVTLVTGIFIFHFKNGMHFTVLLEGDFQVLVGDENGQHVDGHARSPGSEKLDGDELVVNHETSLLDDLV